MIIYYTRSNKTKVFAEALHGVLDMPLYELKSDLDDMGSLKFLAKATSMVFSGKGYPVTNMPEHVPEEIYLCGPIWGGSLVGPPRYFLNNIDLSKTKVNILLTASTPVEKYKKQALEYLTQINCLPGNAYIFATASKNMPELDVVIAQLTEILQEDSLAGSDPQVK